MNDAKHTPHLLDICLAGVGGAAVSLAGWLVFHRLNLPSFGTSNVMRALSTAGVVGVVVLCAVAVWLWLRGPLPKWGRFAVVLAVTLAPALLVLATMALPLSGSRLYLGGLSVDQEFRTQYLTRLADSPQLSDMNYFGLPAFYPALWFWFGGRLANVLGLAGWEVFQPWAVVSMSMAACVLVPVWRRITGSLPVAVAVALLTTIVTLIMSAEEPYAAIVAMGVPAAAIIARRALAGRRFAMLGLICYLGLSASMYTLYTAIIAGTVVLIALIDATVTHKSLTPLWRLLGIGLSSMLIASVVWLPYLLDIHLGDRGAAAHYLPVSGTTIPLPMFAASVLGVLCLLGVVYLVARWRSRDVGALGVALLVAYGWVLLSMVVTVLGTTLLGFRVDVLVALVLGTAGVLGLVWLRGVGVEKLGQRGVGGRAASGVLVVLVSLGLVAYGQQVVARNAEAIDLAYSTTDGFGERADLFPPNAGKFYPEVDAVLAQLPKERRDTVVLTDELSFLAMFPYRGFQAFTAHYANPLGKFAQRNDVIESWANGSWGELSDPQAFVDAVDAAPWQRPDAFVFRVGSEDPGDRGGWTFDLADDIFPNSPNVRFRGVAFNPDAFSEQFWQVKQVGPFVVVTRKG